MAVFLPMLEAEHLARPAKRLVAVCLFFFVLALSLRVALVLALPNQGLIPPREMERVAQSWAKYGSLANPYATPTGPTAHVAPVYPVLLGTVYRVFGTGSRGRFAQAMLSCTLSALRSALVLPLALAIGLGWRAGIIGAALSVPYISAFNTELRGGWEAPLAALLLMAVVWLAYRFSERPDFGSRKAIALGLFAGATLLTCPIFLPVFVLLITAAISLRKCSLSQFGVWAIVLGASAGVVVAPWALRNWRVLGHPVMLRSNFGLELSLAYNNSGYTSALDPHVLDMHPAISPEVSLQVAKLGEIAFNERRYREAVFWIEGHPGKSLRLLEAHIVYFWFPPAQVTLFRVMLAGLTVCSGLGWWAMRAQSPRAAALIGMVWIAFPVIYYVTYWSSRYRYPMDWTLLLATAALLDLLGKRFSRNRVVSALEPQRKGRAATRVAAAFSWPKWSARLRYLYQQMP